MDKKIEVKGNIAFGKNIKQNFIINNNHLDEKSIKESLLIQFQEIDKITNEIYPIINRINKIPILVKKLAFSYILIILSLGIPIVKNFVENHILLFLLIPGWIILILSEIKNNDIHFLKKELEKYIPKLNNSEKLLQHAYFLKTEEGLKKEIDNYLKKINDLYNIYNECKAKK